MKVIDIAEFYTDLGGGVKTYINQKLEAGRRLGHEVIVIAPGRKRGEEERLGGKVIWIPGPPLPIDPRYVILWRQKEVHAILDREKPDVVEGSSPWTGGWFAANWKGKALKSFIFHSDPVAVYPHTMLSWFMDTQKIDHAFGFYWKYLKKLSKKYDTTVVSGEWLAKRTAEFGVKNPVAVPFGIDKSFFSPKRRSKKLRKKFVESLGLPDDAPLFMAVSRHHPEKRLGTVIDGFQKAARQKPMGLLLFGDGPIRKYVKYKASAAPNVKLMGFTENREELANILASCDYFVHGSAAETFGLVVAEAICSGLPIIVPDMGGAADLANPEYSEVYEPGNPDAFADSVLRMLARDRTELSNATAKAAEHQIGTMEQHFENLFELYQSLLDRRG